MLGRARRIRVEFEDEALGHLDALFGTALRLTRNERDAEDLVQDTMLRAYRFWDKFQKGSNCKAWLFKILTNTFINRYHKRRRERELALLALDDETITRSLVSHEATRASRDPERAIAARGLSDDVQHALEALPADFRLAVILCDLEEFSYKEIAEIMDCPVGTVMSRLHRGRKLLQRLLHDYAVEQGILKAPEESDGTDEEKNGHNQQEGGSTPIDLAAYRSNRGGEKA